MTQRTLKDILCAMDSFVADRIFVDAPADVVYRALLNAEDAMVWLGADSAFIDARPGGVFRAERSDGSNVSGVIARLEETTRIELGEYYHEASGVRRGPMRVELLVTPHGAGVWLMARQDGLDSQSDWKQFAEATRREWVRATVALKRHVEGI